MVSLASDEERLRLLMRDVIDVIRKHEDWNGGLHTDGVVADFVEGVERLETYHERVKYCRKCFMLYKTWKDVA